MKALTFFLLLLYGLFFTSCKGPETSMTESEIVAIASQVGGYSAKYSPDGEWILYLASDGNQKTIRKMRVGGTESQSLYTHEGYLCCVNYSRDGRYITFNIGNPDLDIWRMDADGQNLMALTENDIHDGGPSWTYDNQRLIFTSVHNGNFDQAGIYTINPDGSSKQRLHSLDFRAFDPSISHDGRYLMVQHVEDENLDIYRIDLETSERLRVTESDSADWYPAWSPDDSRLAYRNNEGGNWDIYLMNSDGTDRQKVTNSENEDRSPTYSPDGRYIAWQSKAKGSEVFEIWVMNADGTDPRQITSDSFDNQGPRWAPDSKSLVYATKVGETSQVMQIGVDGKGKRIMTLKQ